MDSTLSVKKQLNIPLIILVALVAASIYLISIYSFGMLTKESPFQLILDGDYDAGSLSFASHALFLAGVITIILQRYPSLHISGLIAVALSLAGAFIYLQVRLGEEYRQYLNQAIPLFAFIITEALLVGLIVFRWKAVTRPPSES